MKIETQSTRNLKVLSIDFDYFQNVDADTIRSCYPDGIDLSTELSTIVWSGYYANDRTRNKLSSVTILNDELNLLRKLLTSKDNFRVSTYQHQYSLPTVMFTFTILSMNTWINTKQLT